MAQTQVEVEVEELVDLETVLVDKKNLVIYNDDYNTFEHVIDSLVKVCKHEAIQAEQCTYIIHHNGKCSVKNGTLEDLRPMRHALTERGLDAKIH